VAVSRELVQPGTAPHTTGSPLQETLAEVARVLRPGGTLAAIVPTTWPLRPTDLETCPSPAWVAQDRCPTTSDPDAWGGLRRRRAAAALVRLPSSMQLPVPLLRLVAVRQGG
jgi:hypothetical protein